MNKTPGRPRFVFRNRIGRMRIQPRRIGSDSGDEGFEDEGIVNRLVNQALESSLIAPWGTVNRKEDDLTGRRFRPE